MSAGICIKPKNRNLLCACVAVALGLSSGAASAAILDSYSTGFESPGFTVGAMSDGTTTQNGWSGGAGSPGFTNDNAGFEAITTAAAHSGTQSWRFTAGYNSPGAGTPFSPNLTLGLGDPGVTSISGSLWFRGVGSGDGSSIAINTGNRAGTDRSEIIAYLVNETTGIHLYTFQSDNFDMIDIATGLDASAWHNLAFSMIDTGGLDTLTVSVDGGSATTVNPAGLSQFRVDISSPYADSSRLKFNARSISSGPPTSGPDPTALGFYLDDVSYQVEGPAAAPEPISLALFGIGLAGLGFSTRRRKTA